MSCRFRFSPDTDVSQNDQQFRRAAETSGARKPRKRGGGIVANKFKKKARRCRAFNLPESSVSAWDSFGSCDDAEAVVVVLCHIVDQIDLPGQVFAHRVLAVLAALAW